MAFLKKLSIKKLLAGLKLVFGKQYKLFKENSELAVEVTEKIKQAVNNPAHDILTAIIPGNLDDKILAKAREVADRVAKEVAIAHKLVQASATNNEAWAALLSHLQTIVPEGRAAFWVQWSAKFNEFMSDGKLDFTEAVILVQLVHKEKKLAA